jgi:hypothetical protein
MDSEELFNRIIKTVNKWAPKGVKVLPTGVRLICPTPLVAPEAWLHVVFPNLSPIEIDTMEKKLGMLLPNDFQQFLLQANGLHLFSYRISIFGLRKTWAREGDEAWQPFNLVSHNYKNDRPHGSPTNVLYFGTYDDSWCFFELDGDSYRVGMTDRHHFRPTVYWPDFGTWLIDGTRYLESLFDGDGATRENKT